MKKCIPDKKNRFRPVSLVLAVLMFANILVCSLQAEPTREEEIARKQAEKSKHLAPYVPGKIENYLIEHPYLPLLTPPIGPYPFIGSAYSGGGLAFGPGYRKLFADNGVFDIHGGYSIRTYKLIDGSVQLPDAAAGRVRSLFRAQYIDANKVSFFGIGNDSDKDNKTDFSYRPISVSLNEGFRPVPWFALGGGIEYLKIRTDRGKSTLVPSIEEVFNPITAPGLGLDPRYIVGNVFLQLDWRQSPGYTTSGGVYRAQLFHYNERETSLFNFRRVDLDAAQFFPIFRANQVIALRALASITDVSDNDQVPFFLLPKLGGAEELRGFSNFRFRDRHRMLLTAEYRWIPSRFVDMAIFYEAGKVASRRSDLDFSDLHRCYGIGIRFHSFSSTALRIEVAHSVEGTRIIFGAGPVF